MRRALATVAAAVAAAVASGCGGDAGDLMSITVSGGFAPVQHTIVVSGDGRGSCDRGPLKLLPSERVIEAREIEQEVAEQARRAEHYSPNPDARRYTLRTKAGVVEWSEGTRGLPSVLPRAQLLALQLDRLLCRGQGAS
jgi:hypothetical protein